MMIHAAPRFAVFGMPWVVLLVAAIAVAVLTTRRRRGRYAAGPGPATYPPAGRYNPATVSAEYRPAGRLRGSGPVRRSFWGVVIALIVLAVVIKGLSVEVHSVPATVTNQYGSWEPGPPSAYPVTATARVDQLSQAIKKEEPRRRSKVWFKADRPADAEPEPHWHATIPHVRVLALPNSDRKVLEEVCTRLRNDLGLPFTPPLSFAANQSWVRVPEKTEDAVQHDPQIGDYISVRYSFELTADGWHELGRLERAGRGEMRMAWAACGLGLLTILLGGIAAYIRLDEWTKGYYSGRLFLAASALATGLAFLIVYTLRSWGMPGG